MNESYGRGQLLKPSPRTRERFVVEMFDPFEIFLGGAEPASRPIQGALLRSRAVAGKLPVLPQGRSAGFASAVASGVVKPGPPGTAPRLKTTCNWASLSKMPARRLELVS